MPPDLSRVVLFLRLHNYKKQTVVHMHISCVLEAVQYWLDDSDIDAYMRNLYGALRNGDSQEQERLEQEFFEYLKKGERSIEQCKSDVHAIVSYLLRKTRNAKSAEKIFVQENILEAVFGSRSKAGLWDCVKFFLVVLLNNIIDIFHQKTLAQVAFCKNCGCRGAGVLYAIP